MAAHFCALIVLTLRPSSRAISVTLPPALIAGNDVKLAAREFLSNEIHPVCRIRIREQYAH